MSEQGNESALMVEQVAEIVRRMNPAEMAQLMQLVPALAEVARGAVPFSPPGDDRPTHEIWLEKLRDVAISLQSGEDEGES